MTTWLTASHRRLLETVRAERETAFQQMMRRDTKMAKAKREQQLEAALKNLVEACGHVNIGALEGHTVKDFRKVMKFMAACDAARELVGED